MLSKPLKFIFLFCVINFMVAVFFTSVFAENTKSSLSFEQQLLQEAKKGDVWAQSLLGEGYARGKGMKQDDAKAFYWWNKAAKSGDLHAQYGLGLLYYQGRGVKQDYKKALYWWRKSAQSDDIYGRFY